ncbi:MAG: hypothetical protein KDA77_02720 [Planctomycetaceae bacterium]|nr:hypothetical protein [Planctomycetaceae bacterium]
MSIELAQTLMNDFAVATGITGANLPRRYLWTDAFAVCNYFGLYHQTGAGHYLQLAETLPKQVHHVLGRHRPDHPHQGWISGLSDAEGEQHPTRGGLRIGKKLNERSRSEPWDPQLEWDRDGQYFHYLTRWMHALNRAHQETGQQQYLNWAAELAVTAHQSFTYERSSGGPRRMVWKMSINLSRPLVDSMGHHDPLDGLITSLELQAAAGLNAELKSGLTSAINDYLEMCVRGDWATEDALGIGGLLDSAIRLMQTDAAQQTGGPVLLTQLLRDTQISLQHYSRSCALDQPATHRLAFRELGLSIGLRGLELLPDRVARESGVSDLIRELLEFRGLAAQIESFWSDPNHRRCSTWIDHGDINAVMLATSLVPAGYYGV